MKAHELSHEKAKHYPPKSNETFNEHSYSSALRLKKKELIQT